MTVESKLFGELSKWVMLNISHTLEGTQPMLTSSAPFPWKLDKAGFEPQTYTYDLTQAPVTPGML